MPDNFLWTFGAWLGYWKEKLDAADANKLQKRPKCTCSFFKVDYQTSISHVFFSEDSPDSNRSILHSDFPHTSPISSMKHWILPGMNEPSWPAVYGVISFDICSSKTLQFQNNMKPNTDSEHGSQKSQPILHFKNTKATNCFGVTCYFPSKTKFSVFYEIRTSMKPSK